MLFCISHFLILWTLSNSYCVKCSRISQILVFCILQGSAVTPLWYIEKYDMYLVSYFMENTTVKEFWKLANICQRYKQMYSGSFFWLTAYICQLEVNHLNLERMAHLWVVINLVWKFVK